MTKIVEFNEPLSRLFLEEIAEAFHTVFEGERLQWVEIDPQENRTVFTCKSDKVTRTYLKDPARTLEDIFRNTPNLDTSKVF